MPRINYGVDYGAFYKSFQNGHDTLGMSVKRELDAAAAVEDGDIISSEVHVNWRPDFLPSFQKTDFEPGHSEHIPTTVYAETEEFWAEIQKQSSELPASRNEYLAAKILELAR